jgi:plastocyanin
MATDHVINTQGLTYNPAELTVALGDNITINASAVHPTTQVSQATWEANGTTPLPGGFGTNTASFTFTVEDLATIYYVCDNHIANGMKGLINVLPVGISELTEPNAFSLINNPLIGGELAFSLEDESFIGSMLELYDVSGKMVFQERLLSTSGSLITRLNSGMYLMVLRRNDEAMLLTEKVLIQD